MPVPTYSTAETLLTDIRAGTRIGSNPIATGLQNTAMLRALSDFNDEFVNYPYTQGMLGWNFLIAETIIQTKAATTLNGALSSGDTSIVLTSGTDFDDPASADIGAGYVKSSTYIYDFFTYEDKTTHTLSTVAGLQMDHATASEVHKIYKLPSDFGLPRAIFRQSNVHMYEWQDSEATQVPRFPYYMLKGLTSTNGYSATFMVFPEDIGAHNWKFYYAKKPTAITATTSTVNAPDGAGRRWMIHKGKAYVYGILGETDLEQKELNLAAVEMEFCLSQWAMKHLQHNRSLSLDF